MEDTSGSAARVCISADGLIDDTPWNDHSPGGGGRPTAGCGERWDYIIDQDAPGVGDLTLGLASVSHGGCGVVAAYNALITLGAGESFESVLGYFNRYPGMYVAYGFLGTLPDHVARFFESKGYRVIMTHDRGKIDAYSQTADACIMWYVWPKSYGPFHAFGAHFVHYRKTANDYIAYNTGSGIRHFVYPSVFGYEYTRCYALGIFIYK